MSAAFAAVRQRRRLEQKELAQKEKELRRQIITEHKAVGDCRTENAQPRAYRQEHEGDLPSEATIRFFKAAASRSTHRQGLTAEIEADVREERRIQ